MIKLGYELGTDKEVNLKPSHLIVTGLTQEAGKTTTLEALIKRSKKRAIVFRTKIGEKSFLSGTKIPPYFKDRSDWQFVQGLVEATIKEKLRTFERAKIIQICKQTGGNSLLEFKKRVDERIEEKINSFEKDILTNLQAYLEIVLPKLQSINFSNELNLVDGLNIIDLERFSRDSEVQSLIIRSVVEEVLHNFKDVIIVVPEAWKFIPQGRGNPCKLIVEEFIRQGATNENYLWIDSQDMTNVDKVPIKQISNFILGYQSEPNEVKKTLETIPLPKSSKPKTEDIQTLGKGIFYHATRDRVIKTYVQPFWLDDNTAIKVSLGKIKVEEIDAPETITPFSVAIKKETKVEEVPSIDFSETTKRFNREMNDLRKDFFTKLEEIQEQFNKVYSDIYNLKNKPKEELDEETIISKILQKLPTPSISKGNPVNKEEIIKEVLSRVPKGSGNVVYEVAPLEKLKKDYQENTKQMMLSEISELSEKGKEILKWIEANGKQTTQSEIVRKLWNWNSAGNVNGEFKYLKEKNLVKLDKTGRMYPYLKERIKNTLAVYNPPEEEIVHTYNHILMEMLK